MIMFGKPNEYVSDPGDRYKTTYRSEVMKNGQIVLQESGKIDLWQMINAEAEHCDMAYILKQMSLGNYENFNATPLYGDYSEVPSDYRDVLQIAINVESDFLKLPLEVRQKYNNDFKQWLAAAGTEEWTKLSFPEVFEKLQKPSEEENKESGE